MNFIPLIAFVREHGQRETAALIGCTQGYISQTLAEHRAVYVRKISADEAEAVELKGFASGKDRSLEKTNRLHAVGETLGGQQ